MKGLAFRVCLKETWAFPTIRRPVLMALQNKDNSVLGLYMGRFLEVRVLLV